MTLFGDCPPDVAVAFFFLGWLVGQLIGACVLYVHRCETPYLALWESANTHSDFLRKEALEARLECLSHEQFLAHLDQMIRVHAQTPKRSDEEKVQAEKESL